jgi:membrane protein
MWKVTGMVFTSFIVSSAQYSAIYSGFSILILSLIWLYWSWFILLVGAKVSYYQQYPRLIYARKDPFSLSNIMKEKLALLIMFLIGDNFHRDAQHWRLEPLSKRLALPAVIVQETLTMLEKKGLIITSYEEPPAYLPAKDLETISIREILDAVRISGDEVFAGNKFITIPEVDRLISQTDDALYLSVKNKTLKSLIISDKTNPDNHKKSR